MKPIHEEGVFDVGHTDYHNDPVVVPSFSASVGKTILEKTPRHAWMSHPRLNPKFEREHKDRYDLGEAAHAFMLRDERGFVVVDAPDWRTNAAKEKKAHAHAHDLIPILKAKFAEVKEMVEAARMQLSHHEDVRGCFQIGQPEVTIIWREAVEGYDPVWCRARLDWLHAEDFEYAVAGDGEPPKLLMSRLKLNGNIFPDYKTTEVSAHPDEWGQRTCFNLKNDIRAAFYLRGIKRILGAPTPHYKFVVQEAYPPYALCVQELEPEALVVADDKLSEALQWWAWCTKKGWWPGYPKRTCGIPLPPWRANEWEEIQLRNRVISEEDREARFKLAIAMQAPLELKI